MIKNRPATLLADVAYRTLPNLPLAVDWTSIPELIRLALLDLDGVQPVTRAMADVAGGVLRSVPGDGEVELFRNRGTTFQLISVVLSCVPGGEVHGVLEVRPFAVTLIPASKRGAIQEATIELVAKIDVSMWLETSPIYSGYDPFSGESGLYGNLPGYLNGRRDGFLDEIGLVVDQYFLATQIREDDEILTLDLRMPSPKMREKYERHRKRLFFAPFKKVEARRVWGAETPIELFLLQALAKERLFPDCQMLVMDDGAMFPSLYHLWQDIEFRHSAGLVTEADLYFPKERVAVFCDGAHHSRGKQRAKDSAIDAKLKSLGILPVRIPGSTIKFELGRAVEAVKEALT